MNDRLLIFAAIVSAVLAFAGAALALAVGSRTAAVVAAVAGISITGGLLRGYGQIKRSSE